MKVSINEHGINVYTFESTGRSFNSYSEAIGLQGEIMYNGFGSVIYMNDDEDEGGVADPITAEEKKELALYMIEKWKIFGGI